MIFINIHYLKKNQHIIEAVYKLLKNNFNLEIKSGPVIDDKVENVQNIKLKFNFSDEVKNILLRISGLGPTKRIQPKKIYRVYEFMFKKL